MRTASIKTLIKNAALIAAFLLPIWSFAQSNKPGSVNYLKFCNGIKGIILGSDIREIEPYKLSYLDGDSRPDADSCYKYEYKDSSLLAMGDSLSLDLIAIRVFHNKITNVYLFFKRTDAYKVLSNFLAQYGPFTNRPDDYADVYNWDSSLVSLSLRYQVKTDLGVAIFSCKDQENNIALMQRKPVTMRDFPAFSAN